MTASTLSIVRWIAYGLVATSLVPLILTLVSLHRSRRAVYYAIRRQALRKAQIAALIAIVLLFVAFLLLVAFPLLFDTELAPVVLPLPSPSPTATTSPTVTPRPLASPTATNTPLPTATAPFIPTFTPSVQPPVQALSPLPSAVPASLDARIQVMVLAMGKTDDGQPSEPGERFPDGEHPLYVFFEYGGMEPGVATTFAWYKDGVYFEPCSDTWAWALVEGRDWGTRGGAFYECVPPEGWQPGLYEVRVFIETRLQDVVPFVVD